MEYKKVSKDRIYRLINTGALMLISTRSKNKQHDIAPVAWVCPQEMDPPRLLMCVDAAHKTFKNIKETGVFTAGIPHASQLNLVEETGSVTGKDADKFSLFTIKTILGPKTGCRVPEGMIGYLECRVKKIINIEGTAIVVADVLYAAANPKAFNGKRLLAENAGGKAIHHLGSEQFITYADKITE